MGGLGNDAPKAASTAMAKLFEHGDEAEKLALLHTAKLTGAGELVALAIADGSPLVRVAAVDGEGVLDEIVGAEGEEIGLGGERVGGERGAWDLDHDAERRQLLGDGDAAPP